MKSFRRRLAAAVLAAGVLVLPGCMSILQATSSDGPAVFGGVRLYGRVWAAAFSDEPADPKLQFEPLDLIFLTLDAPLSLAIDFVLMPVSIPNEIVAGGIDPVPYPIWDPPWEIDPPGTRGVDRDANAVEEQKARERRGEKAPPKAK